MNTKMENLNLKEKRLISGGVVNTKNKSDFYIKALDDNISPLALGSIGGSILLLVASKLLYNNRRQIGSKPGYAYAVSPDVGIQTGDDGIIGDNPNILPSDTSKDISINTEDVSRLNSKTCNLIAECTLYAVGLAATLAVSYAVYSYYRDNKN